MKKYIALVVAVIIIAAVCAGCAGNVAKKSEYEVTVFMDSALEECVTEAAKAYTDSSVNENANKKSLIILNPKSSDKLAEDAKKGVYFDIAILDSEINTPDETSQGWKLLGNDGKEYTVWISKKSDNPDATNEFLNYMKNSAGTIISGKGFSVIG